MLKVFYDLSTKEPNKTSQLLFNTIKTLLVLYTFGIVVSVCSAASYFKGQAKKGELQ